MPTMQEQIDDLRARLERVENSPKVKPYLSGQPWPRPMGFGPDSGAIIPVNEAAVAVPKSQKLIEAEADELAAQAAFELAQRRLAESQKPTRNPEDPYGDLFHVNLATPAGQEFLDAERRLIRARVKVFELSKARDAEMREWDRRRNEEAAGIARKSPVEKVRRAFGSR